MPDDGLHAGELLSREVRGDGDLEQRLRGAASRELKALLAEAERSGSERPDMQSQRLAAEAVARHELEGYRAEVIAAGAAPLTDTEEAEVVDRVLERLFVGTAGLERLLTREDVTDIWLNGADEVRVLYEDGSRERLAPIVGSDGELIELARTLAHRYGHQEREFTPSQPVLDLQLTDGSRLAAVAWISDRPYVSIRRYVRLDLDLDDLAKRNMMDAGVHSLLGALVRSRKTLIICGGQGVGKTTLLRAMLLSGADPDERIVTVEDEPELQLRRSGSLHHVVSLTTRSANAEGAGAVSLRDLSRASKRHRPERIVVGEVRGDEVIEMLETITQGIRGAACTIHAESAEGLWRRLPVYAQSYPVDRLMALAAVAIDVVIVLGWDHQGRRAVTEVRLVEDWDPELPHPRTHPLLIRDHHTGCAVLNPTSPMPTDLLDELVAFGYDPSLHPQQDGNLHLARPADRRSGGLW